jgi:hypothetical protein
MQVEAVVKGAIHTYIRNHVLLVLPSRSDLAQSAGHTKEVFNPSKRLLNLKWSGTIG